MIYTQLLNDTGGTVITSYSINSGVTIYTKSVNVERGIDSSLTLIVAGTITINQEVSIDNTNFYTPYELGGRISMALIGSAISTTGLNISLNQPVYNPVVAPYKRFLFQAHSATTLTAVYSQQE